MREEKNIADLWETRTFFPFSVSRARSKENSPFYRVDEVWVRKFVYWKIDGMISMLKRQFTNSSWTWILMSSRHAICSFNCWSWLGHQQFCKHEILIHESCLWILKRRHFLCRLKLSRENFASSYFLHFLLTSTRVYDNWR